MQKWRAKQSWCCHFLSFLNMFFPRSLALTALAASANGYWLMGIEDFITTERLDPVVTPGKVSGHVHSGMSTLLIVSAIASTDRNSSGREQFPNVGRYSVSSTERVYFSADTSGQIGVLVPSGVMEALRVLKAEPSYYLYSDKPGTTTAFPDDVLCVPFVVFIQQLTSIFFMIYNSSGCHLILGNPALRSYDPTSFAQQAVTYLCLNFKGTSTRHNELPARQCPDGIRAQINFPSCWDGKNVDSADHKSHVSFPSGGPDSGTCSDPKFPVTIPRIFLEIYWNTVAFDSVRNKAMNTSQPFVFAHGDPTGYGYHADYVNGWDKGVLQKAVDNCHCNPYGDPTCCVNQGIFSMNHDKTCRITKSIDEQTIGTLPKLPGNNPIIAQGLATPQPDNVTPPLIAPVYAYEGEKPSVTGKVVSAASTSKPTASAASLPSSSSSTTTSTPVATTTVASVLETAAATNSPPAPASKPVAAGVISIPTIPAIVIPKVPGPGPTKGKGPASTPVAERRSNADFAAHEAQDAVEEESDEKVLGVQKERLVKVRRGVHHHHRQAFSHDGAARGAVRG
ncbi:hypothetical protein D9611_001247 [Ephemerocybe angulata]|uniref:DUF1996 domain-containing protein n=1 Tax=Ephemerocybe angulata TaxID=980116 RepID=A0A8H5CIJ5_9AGAR|nr:hypothetical protein D9611_001247 [Tulosesus angulatus]